MGTGIDLSIFWLGKLDLDYWDWDLATGNGKRSIKNGNGIEVMRVDFQCFHVLNVILIGFRLFFVLPNYSQHYLRTGILWCLEEASALLTEWLSFYNRGCSELNRSWHAVRKHDSLIKTVYSNDK